MAEEQGRTKRDEEIRASLWRIQRIRRRIEKGYYERPEVKAEIVEALLEAFLGHGNRRVP